MLFYPSLDYELNTQVRKHREANGYTQEEFAFLIERDVADVVKYEDLTTTNAYDFKPHQPLRKVTPPRAQGPRW